MSPSPRESPTVRLLHLSDLHLRAALPGTSDRPERLSRKSPALLERLAARISAIAPDAIAVTGDLLDVPKPFLHGKIADAAERAAIATAAESDYRFVRRWLDGLGLPFIALPGNHDAYDLFESVFSECAREQVVGGVRLIAFHDREQADNVPHRLDGEALRFRTALEADDGHPQVHLQHFVTRPALEFDYPYNYPDAHEMGSAIGQSGRVLAVLAGHYHVGGFLRDETGVCYSIAPAFCIAPHPVRIFDYDDNDSRSVRTRDIALM
jgi:hypothetical protein